MCPPASAECSGSGKLRVDATKWDIWSLSMVSWRPFVLSDSVKPPLEET
jgi:hypothetical protein